MIRRAAAALLALALASGAVLLIALESGGVAVVETRPAGGEARSTRVWYVEMDGELYVEAGSPENGWYRDVQARPSLRFTAEGRAARYRAHPEPSRRDLLRARLRAKYGWRDRLVGLLVDPARAVPVRLEPLGEEPFR